MKTKSRILALAVGSTLVVAGCSDDGTEPVDGEATVVGRIDQEVAGSPPSSALAAAAAAAAAEVAVVAEVQADGSLSTIAEGTVEADGSFSVTGVPAGREHLVVVAMDASDVAVGRVLVHARTTADATIEVSPIDLSTTLEGRTYARARQDGGPGSTGEVSLLVQAPAATSMDVLSSTEVDAAAAGVLAASAALTAAFGETGTSLDAAARAEALDLAAQDFAAARFGGTSWESAEDAFLDAAVDAMVEGGPSLDAVVQATAASATVMDATLEGVSSFRGALISEAVRLNLRARQHLAESMSGSAEASVAANALGVLSTVESSVMAASTAAEIQAALQAGVTASLGTTIAAVVDLLVPPTDLVLAAEVESLALDAAAEARLGLTLATADTPTEAATVLSSYASDVRTAVQAMVDASGSTAADLDALTSLFIAAFGGAAVH